MLHRPARRPSAPTAAERARTLLEFASSAVLDVSGADLTARPGLPRWSAAPCGRTARWPSGSAASPPCTGSPRSPAPR
ncbi:hypothetical protein [Kitasatospora cheerisanensis]|uniref:hypothetical protein n=1 Tax=Kitasatospora cheerisanensis TaxID=81942 RepID=UPI000563DF1F|nr:hypothetical protein [Kitasatospora cheerisanensis]